MDWDLNGHDESDRLTSEPWDLIPSSFGVVLEGRVDEVSCVVLPSKCELKIKLLVQSHFVYIYIYNKI